MSRQSQTNAKQKRKKTSNNRYGETTSLSLPIALRRITTNRIITSTNTISQVNGETKQRGKDGVINLLNRLRWRSEMATRWNKVGASIIHERAMAKRIIDLTKAEK